MTATKAALGTFPILRFLLLCVFVPPFFCQAELAAQTADPVAAFEQKARGTVGVSAVDVRGRQLLAHRENELFIPASNMKIVSSCFALAKLGGDFRFKTVVYQLGDDVLIIGDFDPTLGDPVVAANLKKTIYAEMDLWAQAIKDRFKNRPIRDVLVLAEGSPAVWRHSDWPGDQSERWYCAPVAMLNFNNNCMDVKFAISPAGPVPEILPSSRFIKVNNLTKGGQKNLFSLRLGENDSLVNVMGSVAKVAADPVSVAINNPPLLAGRVLAERICRSGAQVEGIVRQVTKKDVDLSKAIGIIQTTTPLSLVMTRANKRSLNMAAEGMFLRAGDGTWSGSAAIEKQVLTSVYKLGENSIRIADGSGFSRNNAISPQAMTTLLVGALSQKNSKIFLESLPIGGVDGTLSKRFNEPGYRGRVLGKTGYIGGVSCLSGYILDKSGKPAVAYSILVNKCRDLGGAKALEEDICKKLVDDLDK